MFIQLYIALAKVRTNLGVAPLIQLHEQSHRIHAQLSAIGSEKLACLQVGLRPFFGWF